VLRRLSATVALPEEDNSLANQHADGAGCQASQDAKNGRDDDEMHNARESASKSAVGSVVVMRPRTAVFREAVMLAMGTAGAEFFSLKALERRWGREEHSVRSFMVAVRAVGAMVAHCVALGFAVAALAARFGHAHDAVFGASQEAPNASHK